MERSDFGFFSVVLADVYDWQTYSARTNLTSLRFSSSGSHVSYQTHLHLGSNWNLRCSRNLVIKDFVIDLFIGMLKLKKHCNHHATTIDGLSMNSL